MAIKIISVPAGQAPEEIRRAWVGVVLPTVGESGPTTPQFGVFGGEPAPENQNGYGVLLRDAVEALRAVGKTEAAEWWSDELPPTSILIFGKMFCELVPTHDSTYAEGGL
ncbi:MAG: hypothetical protein RLY47_340 [Candidatus Parcubacteria bacterium]|jgi:hypothetical protein